MKKLIKRCLVLIVMAGGIANAQDFPKVDSIVMRYPKSFLKAEELAGRIDRDFDRPDERARAVYTWIAVNIAYDVKAYYAQAGERGVAYSFHSPEEKAKKEKALRDELVRKTLRSKKAVCQGYAALFQNLCELSGIESEIITGTSKAHPANIGKFPGASDHAWNAVKIDGQWKLVDVTWGAGALDGNTKKFTFRFSDGYFFADPGLFFLNHFPDDKKWLMTDKTEQEFADLPLYFRGYMKAGYTFAAPEKGIISNARPNMVNFKIIDLPATDKVSYAFSSENKLIEADLRRRENVSEFDVAMNGKNRGFLTIYINDKSLAAYKIQR